MSEGPGGFVICGYCGCGCGLHLETGDAGPVGVIPSASHPTSGGRLCRRGWSIHQTLGDAGRLRSPVEKGREVGWKAAFDTAAARLKTLSPQQIGLIASPTSTNESLFLFGKLGRGVIKTNNIDFPGRLAVAPTQLLFSKVGEIACALTDIDGADLIILIGLPDSERAPQIAPKIWDAVSRGTPIISVSSRTGSLVSEATLAISPRPHSDHLWLEAVGARLSPRFGADKNTLAAGNTVPVAGVPPHAIEKVAALIRDAKRIAWIYDASSLERLADTRSVFALARLLGWCRSEKEWVGVLPVVERNNTLGALDMGIAPHLLPGWRSLSDKNAIRRIEAEWRTSLLAERGMDLPTMIEAVAKKDIRAIFVIGDLGASTDPSAEEIRLAFRGLDFLVAVQSFPSPLTEAADLVLPRLLPGEVRGTYTGMEGRIQATFPGISSRNPQEWTIFSEIAERMGADWDYGGLESIRDEIARLVPEYAEAKTTGAEGAIRSLWGDGAFDTVEEPRPISAELPGDEFPFVLSIERTYMPFHFDTDLLRSTLMRRELALPLSGAHVCMHPDDARDHRIRNGSKAVLRSVSGKADVRILCDPTINRGIVILPEVFQRAMRDVLGERPVDPGTDRVLHPVRAVAVSA
jgi:predicted molibdopterin-dependent oxidoreductase YjgC